MKKRIAAGAYPTAIRFLWVGVVGYLKRAVILSPRTRMEYARGRNILCLIVVPLFREKLIVYEGQIQ